jgi:hypothetical protein
LGIVSGNAKGCSWFASLGYSVDRFVKQTMSSLWFAWALHPPQ